jgi:hypothetical protein
MQHSGLIPSELPGEKPFDLHFVAPNLIDIVQKGRHCYNSEDLSERVITLANGKKYVIRFIVLSCYYIDNTRLPEASFGPLKCITHIRHPGRSDVVVNQLGADDISCCSCLGDLLYQVIVERLFVS